MIQITHKDSYFIGALLLLFGGLSFALFIPFLTSLVLAIILAVIFSPLNEWISSKLPNHKKLPTLSTLITLTLVAITTVVPLIFFLSLLYAEISNLYEFITSKDQQSNIVEIKNYSMRLLEKIPGFSPENINFKALFSEGFKSLLSNISTLFSNIASLTLGSFVFLWALFYFLRDGKLIQEQMFLISPLNESKNKKLLSNIKLAIYAIFRGMIAVSILQGVLCSIGFAIFGIPSPVFWGAVSTIAAFIPGIGTGLVIIPAITYLVLNHALLNAIGLTFWGLLPVGLIDNFLRPMMMAKDMKIHPFLVLLSVLGGLSAFGFVGLLLGPIITALFIALIEFYQDANN